MTNNSSVGTVNHISFYMTVRDGEQYVGEAIDSLSRQSCSEWDLIVVSDGSSDKTNQIIKARCDRDKRIRLIVSERIGRGKALNLALRYCTSELVSNLDSDDLAHPERVRVILKNQMLFKNFCVVGGKAAFFQGDAIVQESMEWASYLSFKPVDVTGKLYINNPICHSASVARLSSLVLAGGYSEKLISQLDYELWVRLAKNSSRIGLVDYTLGAKRVHPNQSFERKSHFRYALRSSRIRLDAAKALNVGVVTSLGMVTLHLLWAVVPSGIRMRVRIYMRKKYGI